MGKKFHNVIYNFCRVLGTGSLDMWYKAGVGVLWYGRMFCIIENFKFWRGFGGILKKNIKFKYKINDKPPVFYLSEITKKFPRNFKDTFKI